MKAMTAFEIPPSEDGKASNSFLCTSHCISIEGCASPRKTIYSSGKRLDQMHVTALFNLVKSAEMKPQNMNNPFQNKHCGKMPNLDVVSIHKFTCMLEAT
jgi:hypothetical protein